MSSIIIQWIAVGIIVAIATYVLVRRLTRKTTSTPCADCSQCPFSSQINGTCEERKDGE